MSMEVLIKIEAHVCVRVRLMVSCGGLESRVYSCLLVTAGKCPDGRSYCDDVPVFICIHSPYVNLY